VDGACHTHDTVVHVTHVMESWYTFDQTLRINRKRKYIHKYMYTSTLTESAQISLLTHKFDAQFFFHRHKTCQSSVLFCRTDIASNQKKKTGCHSACWVCDGSLCYAVRAAVMPRTAYAHVLRVGDVSRSDALQHIATSGCTQQHTAEDMSRGCGPWVDVYTRITYTSTYVCMCVCVLCICIPVTG